LICSAITAPASTDFDSLFAVTSSFSSTLDHAVAVARLTGDDLRVEGRMPWSSNATFLVTLGKDLPPLLAGGNSDASEPDDDEPDEPDEPDELGELDDDELDEDQDDYDAASDDDDDDDESEAQNAGRLGLPTVPDGAIRGIYKPGKGERPLWDFPRGLFRREIAAYELSQFLGWEVIPPTVLRDSEYGPGSLQLFIDTNFNRHYFTFLEDEIFHEQLKRMAAFDIVANNTDRKGGHVLADADGHLWGIDNGLCFNEDPKLRTVIWDFAGEALPKNLRPALEQLATAPHDQLGPLCGLLNGDELSAMQRRAMNLLDRDEFPPPRSDHAYPWPLV
jgi:uncharacterized repeat protein (TIGR03843 family)